MSIPMGKWGGDITGWWIEALGLEQEPFNPVACALSPVVGLISKILSDT
jgi:hypothetical protein